MQIISETCITFLQTAYIVKALEKLSLNTDERNSKKENYFMLQFLQTVQNLAVRRRKRKSVALAQFFFDF